LQFKLEKVESPLTATLRGSLHEERFSIVKIC